MGGRPGHQVDPGRDVATLAGVTERILTHPVDGLKGYQEMMQLLEEKEALKVYVNIAG